jgi:hypothetical protein
MTSSPQDLQRPRGLSTPTVTLALILYIMGARKLAANPGRRVEDKMLFICNLFKFTVRQETNFPQTKDGGRAVL